MGERARSAAPAYEADAFSSRWVLGLSFAASTALALVFGAGYSRTLLYVKRTLDVPGIVQPWHTAPYAADQCVDAALAWAAECRGIKAMCDAYIDRVIAECMASQARGDYCAAVVVEAGTTRFGFQECAVRGVRRHIDAEGCAAAYRAIASYCQNLAIGGGHAGSGT